MGRHGPINMLRGFPNWGMMAGAADAPHFKCLMGLAVLAPFCILFSSVYFVSVAMPVREFRLFLFLVGLFYNGWFFLCGEWVTG